VRARIAALPPGQKRPKLLVYGESLGAWGAIRAYSDDGITRRTDGALWVGVPGGVPETRPGSTVLIHPDDPVAAWSPRLILHRSPGRPGRWLPMVSFWQATADVVCAEARPPAGHGHHYGAELTGAWATVVHLDRPKSGQSLSSGLAGP